ncbi:MAG: superoxide dismutase [Alphaproteobacteria bacterium]|nr:superoxide dismutase [Alphaproteobacteria bacterium]
MTAARAQKPSHAPFTLMKLPYEASALAPVISDETVGFHHGKHHKTYVDTLNKLIAGTEFEGQSLEEIVKATAKAQDAKTKKIFNNAGQVWNHDFFWNSLDPKGGKPSAKMKELIESGFGGFEEFKKKLTETGVTQFGSGWAWLVFENGKLGLEKTPNAENMLSAKPGAKALLTIDVWEHAYYLDYQNKRPDFLGAVIDKLLNWRFAEANLG